MSPADVGLKEENLDDDRDQDHGYLGLDQLNRVARWAQPITYLDIYIYIYIYECDSFTMCIFGFPTFSVIPLLDHPGMTVFSKVLYGSLHVRAYDWVEPPRKARNEITFQIHQLPSNLSLLFLSQPAPKSHEI
ncbi:Protein of unknown function D [Prunus dulcis]|uniref:cysteine dioxygenase n=1 Tax=Prunus dulcis TaxID=3755 RepID=A0A4Y1S091_PRUDU|nr:Protein of unknown function D [Prunus dulcis]